MHLTPNEILKLLTDAEMYAMWISGSPAVVAVRAELQTIGDMIDLEALAFHEAINVLVEQSILTESRAADVLAGKAVR